MFRSWYSWLPWHDLPRANESGMIWNPHVSRSWYKTNLGIRINPEPEFQSSDWLWSHRSHSAEPKLFLNSSWTPTGPGTGTDYALIVILNLYSHTDRANWPTEEQDQELYLYLVPGLSWGTKPVPVQELPKRHRLSFIDWKIEYP